jgi:predicted nicotinamide N-methyase
MRSRRFSPEPLPVSSPPAGSRIITPDSFANPAVRRLVVALAHTGTLAMDGVAIPGSHSIVRVVRPIDTETLLDHSESDPEQNLPYWAEIWPSGIALAAEIAKDPTLISHRPVLEVGSGLGITAAIAMAHGADLVATDYAPESLTLTRLTCRLHTGQEPRTRQVNWRTPAANLLQDSGAQWPVVLAADVLYEQRDIGPLLDLFDRIVAPDGLVWLAEPGRRPATAALEQARNHGWTAESTAWQADWPDPKDAGVVVRVHQLRRIRNGRAIDNAIP